jgi:hypothetical protein
MRQVIHIFKKDIRHHWPEVALSLAIVAVFMAYQPRIWTDRPMELRFFRSLINYLPVLMILSWVFLIVRLVQGESLVGDRQFWITRPYEWHKLLAAKLLSILLFIHVPLLIGQILLLKVAEFPILPAISGLLYIQFLIAFGLVMPSLTLGSIASGIGQASLTLVATILVLLGIVALVSIIPDTDLVDTMDMYQEAVYLAGCLSVILIQYILRRAMLARLIVIAGAVLMLLLVALPPYGKLIAHGFPLPSKDHPLPVQFALDPALSFSHTQRQESESFGDKIEVQIPLQLSDFAEDTIIQVRGVKLDLDFASGEHWTSHWDSNYQSVFFDRTRYWPTIEMDRRQYEKFRDLRAKAHLELAVNVFRIGNGVKVSLDGGRLSVAGRARCINDSLRNELRCFAPLKQPSPLVIVANLPNSSCRVNAEAEREGWAQSPAAYADLSYSDIPDLEFSSVREFTIALSRYHGFEDLDASLPICPGTALELSVPRFVYSTRAAIDLGEITLANYHPTYPRRIVPPLQRPPVRERSDSLSWNFAEPLVRSRQSETQVFPEWAERHKN